ncbi:hypothetical protein PanWU01x14_312280 [Parasponia andersonii]|uniref:Transmembrane protein n=1 Tax=Parasponia andersonii TaxID=3476 RepID=A0A2P5APK8_PARAD|nr:hypothetical protein PanWU01x14_312280 [Parasponia andersonii]
MDANSVQQPLLLSPSIEPTNDKKTSLTKSMLKVVMWVVFLSWVAIPFMFLGESSSQIITALVHAAGGTTLGITGSFLLLYFCPVLVISFLAFAYIIISGEEEFSKKKTSRYPSYRLWTFPVIVSGPFGVVSAAEFIGILLFGVYIILAVYANTLQTLKLIPDQLSFKEQRYIILCFS